MKKRIVITGMGAVTPVGIGVENYWRGILGCKCGIAGITHIDCTELPVKRAGEVKDFRARDYLSVRLSSDMDLFMQYAYVAAEEALNSSGLAGDSERTGIVMGTALAGITLTGRTQEEVSTSGSHVGPRFLSKVMGNIAAAQLAINHGLRGPSLTVSTACSSGGDALSTAAMLISCGAADAMVVMAGEAAISPLVINSLFEAGAMSKSGRSRPFDEDRDGFVIGEGGGALILETEEHALARGAFIEAELAGCANNTDAYHTVSPHPEGAGASACMRLALAQAEISPEDIGYINMHGTATVRGDAAETKAIMNVFGSNPVPVSSTKGATGHMMGAGGLTEAIACIKAMQTGCLPPNLGFDRPFEGCGLNIVKSPLTHRRVRYAMSNALGFGGQNSCMILGLYKR